jgi:hypothetical protein
LSKPGFYASNELRSYPLIAGHGGINILSETIVDFGCVMLPGSGFESGVHKVWLYQIESIDDEIKFDFRSDAPGLNKRALVFRFDAGDKEYSTRFSTDSKSMESSSMAGSSSEAVGDNILWEGFLTLGRPFYAIYSISEYATLEDGDILWRGRFDSLLWNEVSALLWSNTNSSSGSTYGKSVIDREGKTKIEPALIQNMSRNYVKSIRLVNKSRTVVTSPFGCPGYTSEVPPQYFFDNGESSGFVTLKQGYNNTIDISTADNSITIGAAVGAGAGEPCAEVQAYPGETNPGGSPFKDGSPACNQTIKSINGIGGPNLNIKGGLGVSVLYNPAIPNSVIVTPDHHGMAVCPGITSSSVGG